MDESCGRTVPHCGAHQKENKKKEGKFSKTKVERDRERELERRDGWKKGSKK